MFVTTISPSHWSKAFACPSQAVITASSTDPHSNTKSSDGHAISGAVSSLTVIVCDTLLSLPHSSTNVHVLIITNEL